MTCRPQQMRVVGLTLRPAVLRTPIPPQGSVVPLRNRRPLRTHYAPLTHPLCAHYPPIMRPLPTHYAPITHPLCAHYPPIMRPLRTHYAPITFFFLPRNAAKMRENASRVMCALGSSTALVDPPLRI